jgi:hypothetical protein
MAINTFPFVLISKNFDANIQFFAWLGVAWGKCVEELPHIVFQSALTMNKSWRGLGLFTKPSTALYLKRSLKLYCMKKIIFPKSGITLIPVFFILLTLSACNSDDYSQQDHTEPTQVDHAPSDSELSRSLDSPMVDKTRVALDSADRMKPLNTDSLEKVAKDSADRVHPGKADKH